MATQHDHPQSVVSKISESVSAALDELHLAMEAFGDAVAIGEGTRTEHGEGD